VSNAQWAEFFMGYEKNSVWLFPFVKKKKLCLEKFDALF